MAVEAAAGEAEGGGGGVDLALERQHGCGLRGDAHELLAARDAWVEPQARLPEQEFLSEYFQMPTKQDVQRAQRKTRGRFRSPLLGLLPERFNSCRHLLHALSPAASAEEVAALDHTCVVHACAGKKLNRLPLCMWAPRRGAVSATLATPLSIGSVRKTASTTQRVTSTPTITRILVHH